MCAFDWSPAFEVLATGRGKPIRASDSVIDPAAPVLDHGRSINIARWGLCCTSRRTGMTFTNAERHGFTVARRSQEVF